MAYGSYSPRTYNPYYEPPPRFGTSAHELLHIAVAMVVLTAVLWIVFEKNQAFTEIQALPFWGRGVAAFLISLLGFVLHELGHKFTAQHFGHWSEFRANWGFLGLSLVLAVTLGVPIAAPGATWHTAQSRGEQGKISAMGPLVNCAVAVGAFFFTFGPRESVRTQLALVVVFFSAVLALFNLIPIGPLDGRKILAWNPIMWIVIVGLSGTLLYFGGASFFTP